MLADPELKLTVSQVCARLPGARSNRRVHPATVVRWITAGCPARDGRRVKLTATRCGSRWLVAQSDLDEFFARLAAEPSPVAQTPTPAERDAACERAECELRARGM